MIFYYYLSYDEKKDEFFGMVDDGTRAGETIFHIDDTDEMVSYIKSGQMSHIDDVEGLEGFLKQEGLIQEEDSVLIREEMMW